MFGKDLWINLIILVTAILSAGEQSLFDKDKKEKTPPLLAYRPTP